MEKIALNPDLLSKEYVQAISQKFDEPDWVIQKRQAAWEIFNEIPYPTTSDEAWRRTSLRRVRWKKFAANVPSSLSLVASLADLPDFLRHKLDEDRSASGRMVFANGVLIYREMAPALAEKGVIFADLQSAVRTQAELVQPHLAANCVSPSDSKFAALNAALWSNGPFLYVPKALTLEDPFQVVILLDGNNAASIHRSLIIAESEAEVDYIEETTSLNEADLGLNVGVTEIIAAAQAQVRYVAIQNLGQNVYNFNTKRALVQADANVIWEVGEFGSLLTKTFIDGQLIGDGASTECNGVYFLTGRQHVDLDCLMQHTGYATGGDLLIHGALKDKSRAIFIGMIKIDESGQLTNSYLKNQNLLLDPTARADSIPQLEIDANDVRASHAATISKVEEDYIFYLQSRGIPREQAVALIVNGFFTTIFDRMGNERVRDKMIAAVAQRMEAG